MIVDILSGLATGGLTGINPTTAQSILMGTRFNNDKAIESEQNGDSYWKAYGRNIPSSVLQGYLERMMPEVEWAKGVSVGSLKEGLKYLLKSAGKEFAEEALQQASEEIYDDLFNKKYVDYKDTKSIITDSLYSGAIGAILGGMGAGKSLVQGVPQSQELIRQNKELADKNIESKKQGNANNNLASNDESMKIALAQQEIRNQQAKQQMQQEQMQNNPQANANLLGELSRQYFANKTSSRTITSNNSSSSSTRTTRTNTNTNNNGYSNSRKYR